VSELSDRVLWRQAREGDGAAFGVLFERHAGRIYNYCFRRTADWALAEELTSTTFLLAWRGRGRSPLQAESALPLLYGIATNVLRNQRRSLRRRREAFARLPLERVEEPDFAEEIAMRLDDEAAMRELLRLFGQLPRRQQDRGRGSVAGAGFHTRTRPLPSTFRSARFARAWRGAVAACGNSRRPADPKRR